MAPEDALVQLLRNGSGLELEVGQVLAVDVDESCRRVLYPAQVGAAHLDEASVPGGWPARFVEPGEALAGMATAERLRLLGALHAQRLGRVAHMTNGIPAPSPAASSARLYNAYQGDQRAKDAYPMELYIAKRMKALGLDPRLISRENRSFLLRAVEHAVRDRRIDQFLDIGTGIPADSTPENAALNPHQVAQTVIPSARVVYVDNDPTVIGHAVARLASGPKGRTSCVEADLRDPETILREAAQTLDFSRPVGLLLSAVLHFVQDAHHPRGIMRTLISSLAPGSCVVVSHMTDTHQPQVMRRAESVLREMGTPSQIRSLQDISTLLDGLELTAPGLVPVHRLLQPDAEIRARPAEDVPCYGAFALVAG
ncbi:SAM-dependent methyltransferase [Streptomyces sp. NBC_00838]|uniref:SAM-dependent methyltransferase n=1 Tax=Streptomyces sp. NBC_00838 TaxID=2903680 RepID=UPI003864601D|nr:SAM-dependent methyltransferase [Streptomyces sp. NBC_00838]